MSVKPIKTYYYTGLPHIQPIGEVFFITFRLADSLPLKVVEELKQEYQQLKLAFNKIITSTDKENCWKEQKRYFSKFDNFLDSYKGGNHWLKNLKIADLIAHKLLEFDKKYYDLYAYVIMSNHVHILVDFGRQLDNLPVNVIITQDNYKPLYEVMRLIKGATARYANQILARTGNNFWQRDNYDHYVRNGTELNNIVNYIVQNPVKAGLVQNWQDFPFVYVTENL